MSDACTVRYGGLISLVFTQSEIGVPRSTAACMLSLYHSFHVKFSMCFGIPGYLLVTLTDNKGGQSRKKSSIQTLLHGRYERFLGCMDMVL